MGSPIKFGTAGWRALLAEDFTFSNVRSAVRAIAGQLQDKGNSGQGVVIARDGRFLGEKFVRESAEILAGLGVPSWVCPGMTPTPVVASCVLDRQAAGSINFTASHNPAFYQGLKFNSSDAGPADTSITNDIEERIEKYKSSSKFPPSMPWQEGLDKGLIHEVDPVPDYKRRLEKAIPRDHLQGHKLRILFDAMHGCAGILLPEILEDAGHEVTVLHGQRDVLFGGRRPEPAKDDLPELIHELRKGYYDLGLATDGDADRYGIVDSGGRFISPNEFLCLATEHMAAEGITSGSIVRTVATTRRLDRIAKAYEMGLVEVPVGFKYIAEIMSKEKVILGGEESGGLTFGGHLPEKDGILACAMAVKMMARSGKVFQSLLDDLDDRYGSVFNARLDLKLTPREDALIRARLSESPPKVLGNRKVSSINRLDGVGLSLEDGSWCLVRFSGTEPLVRWYVEAENQSAVDELLEEGKKMLSV